MVHKRASIGCHKCRERHTRCDNTRPACTRCTASGLACPGYRDVAGIVFKDQSLIIAKKHWNKVNTYREKPRGTNGSSECRSLPSISAFLQQDPAIASVCFFFNTYLSSERNLLTSRGHFDHLIKLYSRASSTSSLALATHYMTGNSLSVFVGYFKPPTWICETYMLASKAVRQDISNPMGCNREELLLSILILDFAEKIECRRFKTEKQRTHIHQLGAMALLNEYSTSLSSVEAQALIAATRANAIQEACRRQPNQDIMKALTCPLITAESTNPAQKLDEIIAGILQLEWILRDCGRTGKAENAHITQDERSGLVRGLDKQLLSWRETIPKSWHPISGSVEITGLSNGPTRAHNCPTLDVAFLYNQWRCARLMIIKIMLFTSHSATAYTESDVMDRRYAISITNSLAKDIFSSIPFFIRDQNSLGKWFLFEILQWVIEIIDELEPHLQIDSAYNRAFKDIFGNLQ